MAGKNEKKKKNFMLHRKYIKFKCQCPGVKFYWHTAMSISLSSIWQCFIAQENWVAVTETILPFGHSMSLFRPDLEYMLLGGITVLKSTHCNSFTRKCQCLRWLYPFMLLSAVDGRSCCSTFSSTLHVVRFKILTNLLVVQWYFGLNFLIINRQ